MSKIRGEYGIYLEREVHTEDGTDRVVCGYSVNARLIKRIEKILRAEGFNVDSVVGRKTNLERPVYGPDEAPYRSGIYNRSEQDHLREMFAELRRRVPHLEDPV